MGFADDPHTPWPKVRNQLSPEQQRIWEEWNGYFLDTLYSRQFAGVYRFNHRYPLRSAVAGGRTLEIGAGTGTQLDFESAAHIAEYVALELRPTLSKAITPKHPTARVVVGDCQRRLEFPDGYFDRALAIHVLEHLDNLPAALEEIKRVLRPGGLFSVVIPADGGSAYWLGRRVSIQRMFEKHYRQPYGPFVRQEHLNTAREILGELKPRFRTIHRQFYPLGLPLLDLNLVIGLTLENVV